MRRQGFALAALLSSAMGASAAQAQVSADQMTATRPDRRMNIQARATATYDDNVGQTNALSPPTGLKNSEITYTPSVNVDLLQPVGQQVVFVRGAVGYTFHDANKKLDNSHADVSGGVGGRLGPCGTVAQGGYSRARTELDDRFLTGTVNNIIEISRVDASLTCVRPPGLGVFASGGKDWGHNSLARIKLADFETTRATAGISFGRPSVASVSLFGNYGRTEYPNQPQVAGKTRGYETTGAGVQAERRFGARIQGSVSVGYSHVKQLAPTVPVPGATFVPPSDYDGLTYSGSITYRVSNRLSTEARFSRQISPTLLPGKSYDIQSVYGLRADYQIGSRFTVSLGGVMNENRTKGDAPTLGVPSDARTKVFTGTLRYLQSRRLSFVLNAVRAERTSEEVSFNYTRQQIGLGANFTY